MNGRVGYRSSPSDSRSRTAARNLLSEIEPATHRLRRTATVSTSTSLAQPRRRRASRCELDGHRSRRRRPHWPEPRIRERSTAGTFFGDVLHGLAEANLTTPVSLDTVEHFVEAGPFSQSSQLAREELLQRLATLRSPALKDGVDFVGDISHEKVRPGSAFCIPKEGRSSTAR